MNNAANIHAIFLRLQAQNPHPSTELVYHSPFELLIAVILSAQATDISVNKATQKLYTVANTPQAMLDLGEEGLKKYIKSIGLYNTKAAHIIKTSQLLLNLHKGQVPNERDSLEALAGVGRKTANVVLNTAFGQPTIAVDTHIFRVAKRLGLANSTTVAGVEKQLLACIPSKFKLNAHHWLILHGRYVCMARSPKCQDCILADLCPSAKI